MAKKKDTPCFPPMLVIPESFEECLTYGQRQLVLLKMIQDLQERVEALEQQNNNN